MFILDPGITQAGAGGGDQPPPQDQAQPQPTAEDFERLKSERDYYKQQSGEWQSQAQEYYDTAVHYETAFNEAIAKGATPAQAKGYAETQSGVIQKPDGSFVDQKDIGDVLDKKIEEKFNRYLGPIYQSYEDNANAAALAKIQTTADQAMDRFYDIVSTDPNTSVDETRKIIHQDALDKIRAGKDPKTAYVEAVRGRTRLKLSTGGGQPKVTQMPGMTGYNGGTTTQPQGLEGEIAQAKQAMDDAEKAFYAPGGKTKANMDAVNKTARSYYGLVNKKSNVASQVI